MTDTIIAIIVIVVVFLGLPVGFLVLRDRLSQPTMEQMEESARQFNERLQTSDFAALEAHFGCPLPDCVRALYANAEELMRRRFEVAPSADLPEEERLFIAFYQPAYAIAAKESWPGIEKYFAFANDGFGNEYIIDPRELDPAILFHDHEDGEIMPICSHFTEFMRWPRFKEKE